MRFACSFVCMPVNYSNGDLVALKCTFKAANSNTYGSYIIIYEPDTFNFLKTDIVASMNPAGAQKKPTSAWADFQQQIQKNIYENQYNKTLTAELSLVFQKLSRDDNFMSDLRKAMNSKDPAKSLERPVFFMLKRYIPDDELAIVLHFETFPADQLEDEKTGEEPATNETSDSSDTETLACELALAPVGGKHVQELKKGDMVMARLVPATSREKAIIEQKKLRTPQGSVEPIPAQVMEVHTSTQNTEFLVKFESGKYGKGSEEEKILVRMYNPATDNKSGSKKKSALPDDYIDKENEPAMVNKSLYIIAGGVVIIVTILLILGYLLL